MGSDVKNNSKVILKQINGMLRRGELNEVHADQFFLNVLYLR